jgi:ABC-type nitrate/sulfonate/bicarbonate transport system permease component
MSDVGIVGLDLQPRRAGRGRQLVSSRALTTVVVGAVLLVGWYAAAVLIFTDGHTLPRPTDVARALSDNRNIWQTNAFATLGPALKGLAIGTFIALALAMLTVLLPFTERPVLRIAVAVYSLPIVAVGPILQVSLSGDAPATALAALSVVFTTLVAVANGLRSTPPNSGDFARALGGLPLHFFWKVRVPSALPSFFAGLRIAFPAAVIGSMIGEFMGAQKGLAVLMINFVGDLNTAATWATGVVITAISTIGFVLIGVVARAVTKWIPPSPPVARVTSRSRLRKFSASLSTFAVASAVMLLGWIAYLSIFDINSFVGKRPADVWRYLTSDETADGRRAVIRALNQTLTDAGVGLAVGWGLAICIAASFVLWAPLERTLMPVALAFRSVPILAILPLLTLVFGRDLLGTVVIVSIIVFFPTLVLVLQALRGVPDDLAAISHAYNAGPFTLLRKVRFPMALPATFASLRIACPAAVLGALLSEWLATGKGVGYLMLSATTQSDYSKLWAASVVMTAVAVLAYTITDALERAVIGRFAPTPAT